MNYSDYTGDNNCKTIYKYIKFQGLADDLISTLAQSFNAEPCGHIKPDQYLNE